MKTINQNKFIKSLLKKINDIEKKQPELEQYTIYSETIKILPLLKEYFIILESSKDIDEKDLAVLNELKDYDINKEFQLKDFFVNFGNRVVQLGVLLMFVFSMIAYTLFLAIKSHLETDFLAENTYLCFSVLFLSAYCLFYYKNRQKYQYEIRKSILYVVYTAIMILLCIAPNYIGSHISFYIYFLLSSFFYYVLQPSKQFLSSIHQTYLKNQDRINAVINTERSSKNI